MNLFAQYVAIAIAVILSGLFVWKSRFPASFRRTRIAIAMPLVRQNQPGWIQRVGRWIAPISLSNANSCGGCDGCG